MHVCIINVWGYTEILPIFDEFLVLIQRGAIARCPGDSVKKAFTLVGVTNGLCEHSRACRALRFFCEHEQK